MKFSQQPFRSSKSVSGELQAKNARWLTQAGYIHQEVAGVYSFLPLGLRVLNKIEAIVREEMDKIGVEIVMTALSPTAKWEQTGRLETVDVLMKTVGANQAARAKFDGSYVLNSTHEEMVTPLVQEFAKSYRDLPVAVYQIQTKFRGEPRAKSGLLRCREFRMKDLYSFHTSAEDLKSYYEAAKKAYQRVFERLGLGELTVIALASGGDFTTDYSHEFQTICEAGEDTLFRVPSTGLTYNKEVAPSQAPKLDDDQEEMQPLTEVEGQGMIGVKALADFLKISVAKTTKTMLYQTEAGDVVAAAVRGGYEIDETKLKKILGCREVQLLSPDRIKELTGAEVGYAGVLNLPPEVRIIFDESTSNRKNFECGANKTNFHTLNVNWGRDLPIPEKFYDIKVAQSGDLHPETGEVYEVLTACEVGNIFPLHTKFSEAFNYTYAAEDGTQKPVYMGCYGIGPSRLMGVLVEVMADDKGLVWPKQVAPFQAHLVSLPGAEAKAEELYQELTAAGVEILWDDRAVSPGTKFSEADMLGIPVRLVVSQKTGDNVEWKARTSQTAELLTSTECLSRLQ